MGPHEPYWQTNTSFSPPSSRWDFRFSSEQLPFDSHGGNMLYGSSTLSNSKERRWMRGNHLYNHQYSFSDGNGLFLSSPDLSQAPQWTPPAIQEISIDDYETSTRVGRVLEKLPSTPILEGTSGNIESRGSVSSHSDSSESEYTFKSCLSSHCNFPSRRSFLSKPIHPLSFSNQTPTEAPDNTVDGFSEFDSAIAQRETHHWSSATNSVDFSDVSETFEFESFGQSCISPDGCKCGLCQRFLSQRSPWSSRRIVRSGDMPVAGVLPCHHVFHAECLEQITPKLRKSDPPCPLCVRLEENSLDQKVHSRLKNSLPRLRPFSEDGPSRPWGCVQMGDCVAGALHVPPQNSMLLLNRNPVKKNLSTKGNFSKEFPGRLKKSGSCSLQMPSGKSVDLGAVGCSKTTAGPSMSR